MAAPDPAFPIGDKAGGKAEARSAENADDEDRPHVIVQGRGVRGEDAGEAKEKEQRNEIAVHERLPAPAVEANGMEDLAGERAPGNRGALRGGRRRRRGRIGRRIRAPGTAREVQKHLLQRGIPSGRRGHQLIRVSQGEVEAVILATNPPVEGEATASWLARMLEPIGVRTTRIGLGLPIGSDLEYADELTLDRAMEGRRPVG